MADSESLTQRILHALPSWKGYSYGHTVDFPSCVRGVPSKLVDSGSKQIDCSTFTWGLLCQVYPDADWSFDRYKKWQMWDRDDLWGPITQAREMGLATDDSGDGWYLYQVWKGQWSGGHSFLGCVADGRLLVLEATNASRPKPGVVWRNVGYAEAYLPPWPEYSEEDATRSRVYAKIKLS